MYIYHYFQFIKNQAKLFRETIILFYSLDNNRKNKKTKKTSINSAKFIQGKFFLTIRTQHRAAWLRQWNWASQVISQAGLQHTYFFHGYWFEPRQEWFFRQNMLDIKLEPFTLKQLGASFIWLGAGMLLSTLAFSREIVFWEIFFFYRKAQEF